MERLVSDEVRKLHSRAAYYRMLAAGAESRAVWEERTRAAIPLEREAAYTERAFSARRRLRRRKVERLS